MNSMLYLSLPLLPLPGIKAYESELTLILNTPINIFPTNLSHMYISSIENIGFKALNHYMPHSDSISQNTFILNSNGSAYELSLNIIKDTETRREKVCEENSHLTICAGTGTRFSIEKSNKPGYTIQVADRCLTLANDSLIRMEPCADGAEEQLFDFKPVRILECNDKYSLKSLKDSSDSKESNSKEGGSVGGVCARERSPSCVLRGRISCEDVKPRRRKKEKREKAEKGEKILVKKVKKKRKHEEYTSEFSDTDCPICEALDTSKYQSSSDYTSGSEWSDSESISIDQYQIKTGGDQQSEYYIIE